MSTTTDMKHKTTLKLLIHTRDQKVLFAESSKEFVDFLFTLLTLPAGTVIRLLADQTSNVVGSLGKIYESVENLSESYLQPNVNKDSLLKPKVSTIVGCPTLLSLPSSSSSSSSSSGLQSSTTKKMYMCPNYAHGRSHASGKTTSSCCLLSVLDDPRAVCSNCRNSMIQEVSYVAPPDDKAQKEYSSGEGGGYVKGLVTYMVMDNLEVKPMSSISSISLLTNEFNVKDLGVLEEKTVTITKKEGLKLLKASLLSKTVLTDVFLSK